MSRHVRVPIAAMLAAAALLVPAGAQAARHLSPNGRHAVSLLSSENPITYGDPLVLFGRLVGPNNGGRAVTLWHRVNGVIPVFTPIQTTTTDAAGFYAFQRLADVVDSNREYYVTSLGARSRTVREKVVDVVTLNGPATGTSLTTGVPAVQFTGTVTPADVGNEVVLQRQSATGDGLSWGTIQRGIVGPGGAFTFNHVFRVPGDANIRALVRGTNRHLASGSPSLTYEISQAENPALTATASADPIPFGSSVTISGTLAAGAEQPITLYAHERFGSFMAVAQVTTGPGGAYSFPAQSPVHSTFYQVRAGQTKSRIVFEGVTDVLTATASASSIPQGGTVTFSGGVSPDQSGHVIWLQEENAAGTGFHTVQVAFVLPGSTYTIVHQLFAVGTHTFRVEIPGGPLNGGANSQTFPVTVTPVSPQSLPQTQPAPQSQGQ
jgi:hypothetical protein